MLQLQLPKSVSILTQVWETYKAKFDGKQEEFIN